MDLGESQSQSLARRGAFRAMFVAEAWGWGKQKGIDPQRRAGDYTGRVSPKDDD